MTFILPDGRKAEVLGQVTETMSKIQFEDGRQTMWPTSKIPKETQGEDTLKLVVIPAIDRLEEFINDRHRLMKSNVPIGPDRLDNCISFENELRDEAQKEFLQKWGLT